MASIAPPRRISKTRKRKRRTHQKLDMPGMTLCPNCGEVKLSHHICKSCGFYDGRQVVNTVKNVEEIVEEPAKKTKKPKATAEDVKTEKETTKPAAKKTTKKVDVEKDAAPKKPAATKTTKKPTKAE